MSYEISWEKQKKKKKSDSPRKNVCSGHIQAVKIQISPEAALSNMVIFYKWI